MPVVHAKGVRLNRWGRGLSLEKAGYKPNVGQSAEEIGRDERLNSKEDEDGARLWMRWIRVRGSVQSRLSRGSKGPGSGAG